MKKTICLLTLACCASFAIAEECSVLTGIKKSVKRNWDRLAECSGKVVELHEEARSLPDKSIWFWVTDKRDQNAKIRKQLMRMRELLLSTTAQELMREVDRLDRQIAEADEELRTENERAALDPDNAKKHQDRAAKIQERKSAYEATRREHALKVSGELRALGLDVAGPAAEQCIFTVNFGDLIDGVVVARNIAAVVENLRQLMVCGDVAAARRYFGIYVAMVEVQIACFEDYLDKSRNGEWRQGVNRILADAQAARAFALQNADCADFTPEQRAIFQNNSRINDSTISAAKAYLRVLDAHETVIADKLKSAQRVHKVVANSYATINLAGDFIRLAKSNQDAFDALLKLELPPIESFRDAAIQQEFQAITRKLSAH